LSSRRGGTATYLKGTNRRCFVSANDEDAGKECLSDSEWEERPEGRNAMLKLDDWIVFCVDGEAAQLALHLRHKWNALFLRRMRGPAKAWSAVSEQTKVHDPPTLVLCISGYQVYQLDIIGIINGCKEKIDQISIKYLADFSRILKNICCIYLNIRYHLTEVRE